MRTPFESFDNIDFWQQVSKHTNISVDAIKDNPALLVWPWDMARTDAFYFTWVDYIPGLLWWRDRSSMRFIDYQFQTSALKGMY